MESLQLLKEIEAWLCFNTEPPKEEIAKLRKSINDHVTEQLNLHNVIKSVCCISDIGERCEAVPCEAHCKFCEHWLKQTVL